MFFPGVYSTYEVQCLRVQKSRQGGRNLSCGPVDPISCSLSGHADIAGGWCSVLGIASDLSPNLVNTQSNLNI